MAATAVHVAALYLLFLLAAITVFSGLKRAEIFGRLTNARLVTVCLVISPVVVAWVLSWLLRLLPGQGDSIYLIMLYGFFGLPPVLAGIRARRRGERLPRLRPSLSDMAVAIIILGLTWSVTGTILHTPVMANDPLEYFSVARVIYETKALSGVYPLVDTSLSNGFYAPWTHPPGFVLQLVLGFLMQGTAEYAGAAKVLNAYVFAAFMALVYVWAGGGVRWRGLVAALFLPLTPLLFHEVYEIHIDVVRIGIWTAAFLLLPTWFRSLRLRDSLALGVVVGLAMFVHSIGLLFWALFLGLVLVLRTGRPATVLVQSAVAVLAALLVVLPDYLQNLALYGRVIGDSTPLWEIEELKLPEFVYEQRGLITVGDRIRNGVLAVFGPTYFGRAQLLALLLIVAFIGVAIWRTGGRIPRMIGRFRRPLDLNVWMLAFLGFIGVLVLSALLGIELVIKNQRYLMTMAGLAPILLVAIADFLLVAARRVGGRRIPGTRIVVTLVALLMVDAVVNLASYFDRRQRDIFATHTPDVERTMIGETLICSYGPFRIAGVLNAALAEGGDQRIRVLTFRPAEAAFFADYPIISYIDPVLLPAYTAPSPDATHQILREIGVTHILETPYLLGEIENTAFRPLLDSPDLVHQVRDYDGFRLWRLDGLAPFLPPDATMIPVPVAPGQPFVLDLTDPDQIAATVGDGSKTARCGPDLFVPRRIDGEAILEAHGHTVLYGARKARIDTGGTYRMSFEIRVLGEKPARTEAGLATFNADGQLETDPPGAHRYGVALGVDVPPEQGWVTLSGVFSGTGNERFDQFREGTRFASPVLLLNQGSEDAISQVRNIRLEQLDE
jgi:hypothetical protein